MCKVITVKCPSCGETLSFNVGADADFATFQDALAHVTDAKETERFIDAYMKISNQKSDAEMTRFNVNFAESLANIKYDACGETIPLFDPACSKPINDSVFNPQIASQIAVSHSKWADICGHEGVVAFEAIYFCPKHKHLKQGMHISLRWQEDKKERSVFYTNKCDACSSPMLLADDANAGFCHEGLTTIGKCPKCNVNMNLDTVQFNKHKK